MKKKILIGSIIAVILLTLVSFSSVVGYSSVKSNPDNVITDELDFEYCKDYLFETIIEIADNPEAKELINNNNHNLFSTKSNFRHNPMFPFRRNTNKLSVEHLDFLYKMGLKIIDRLGEEKFSEMMETISIDKPDFVDELDTIIMSNDELRDKIYNLNKMNSNKVSITDFEDYPVICLIIGIIFAGCYAVNLFTEYYFDIFKDNNNVILYYLLYLVYSPFLIVGIFSMSIFFLYCWDMPY